MNERKPRDSAPDGEPPSAAGPGARAGRAKPAGAGRPASGRTRSRATPGASGTGARRRPAAGRGERKAVLNVTISESLAEDVRRAAALGNTTISSVVERALAEQISWEIIRAEGLAAIDAYYREHGYPTEEEMAAAEAQVEEEHRIIDEALAAMAARGEAPLISRGKGRGRGPGRGAA